MESNPPNKNAATPKPSDPKNEARPAKINGEAPEITINGAALELGSLP